MPVLKHAKKKLRQDKKRTLRNKTIRNLYKKLIKKAEATKTAEAVSAAFQQIDKAAKENIIHTNKAARLKSSLSRAIDAGRTDAAAKTAVAVPAKPKKEKAEKLAKTTKTPKKSSKTVEQ